ncbi:YqaA family protein [Pasteurella atlantica]|uniref:YqaA family protein n=2 Tax=Pasteurellaceae TaxID=712 RepID=A0ACC6HPH6_9PAST|nr:YqaA family protein [Pasteurella atlantica]MDP8052723.1 YqaA family protein [Pasteurella atlantica]MDP8100049.1 YqaA family protein [Pasteurella atlantica]MDP8105996.1 YqaA family protein [Pasteurella atlantica]MDP8107959.1 YqaA family protein [Pasteurella atlantica]MDP8117661.1 YqaA family protein [Pasteurella atlantica]
MKLFGTIYDKVMEWSSLRLAWLWLSLVSFIEAIFFPIPPDVMLIPMSMSQPKLATRYAIYTTIASVMGGMIGYGIGFYAFDWVKDIIFGWGYQAQFDKTLTWFEQWGILVVFLAGFSPIPYKIFTICAGVMQMLFLPFVLTAAISRFLRFLLVARLSAWGGEKYAHKIRKSIEIIGWAVVLFVVIVYSFYQFFK